MRAGVSRGRTVALAWVAGAALLVPGCVLSVGSKSGGGDDRVERLERRIEAAERRLGIDASAATSDSAAAESSTAGEVVR